MPYRTPAWRIAAGIVISLLLHLAAMVFLRLPEPRLAADPRSWLTQVEVRIVAPPPPTKAPPEPPPALKPERRQAAAGRRARPEQEEAKSAKAAETAETAPAPQAAPASTMVLVPAAPGIAQPFDREAAKAAARDIAGELDTSPPKVRATRQEKLARQIQNAARPDCKDGIPGGLLAPLYLMMDKKDSGCKW